MHSLPWYSIAEAAIPLLLIVTNSCNPCSKQSTNSILYPALELMWWQWKQTLQFIEKIIISKVKIHSFSTEGFFPFNFPKKDTLEFFLN